MRAHTRIDHFAVAAACRANPGEWQPVGEYNSPQSAYGVAAYISTADTKKDRQRSAYEPAGSFEARRTLTEFGVWLEARYVGLSSDAAWADAVAELLGGA
ncbi:hypothetical protein ACIRP5_11645 [Streptomyces sp. NPDC101221]|uniref:hypothetical protein n=1 Tax=Streptomyces sp. NPDC101221 TaxID=3366132 RepID=UPI0037F5792D